MSIVEFQNVGFHYDEQPKILNNLNLNVKKGEFIAVLGHNGSGKSTIAKLINALYLPTEGTITVCNINTTQETELWKIRQHAGMVFQNPDNQLVATVVREDIAFGLENIGTSQPSMDSIITQSLQQVGMADFADRPPHSLSGGQKQRVAIAGILAMMPQVIIFDESTSMLDPLGKKEVLDIVKKINQEQNITIIWITHFMEEALLSDSVIVMHKGEIIKKATPTEVFQDFDTLKMVGLDIPPLFELKKQLLENHIQMHANPTYINTVAEEILAHYANTH